MALVARAAAQGRAPVSDHASERACDLGRERSHRQPRQRHVAYLGSYHHREQDVDYRAAWWHRMTAKLDSLYNRIPPDVSPRIEAALAKLVKPVAAKQMASYVRARERQQLAIGKRRADQ